MQFYYLKDIFLPLIYLFIYLYQSILIDFILWVIMSSCHYLFVVEIAPSLACDSHFSCFLCPFDKSLLFLDYYLNFKHKSCPNIILYSCSFSPRISIPSTSHDFLYWRMAFKQQDLGSRCTCSYWGVTESKPFQQRARRYVYVCIRTPMLVIYHLSIYLN